MILVSLCNQFDVRNWCFSVIDLMCEICFLSIIDLMCETCFLSIIDLMCKTGVFL